MLEIDNPHENAYKTFPGPILLLAGPGTGKTYQLAKRIKFLIEDGDLNAQPNQIAVITFTKEAARNMKGKLSEENKEISIDRDKYPEIIGTMHSLGNTIIGSKPERFGLTKKYGILDNESQRKIFLKDAATLAGYNRDEFLNTDECRRKGSCEKTDSESKCKICSEYCKILRKCSLVDWDDLIMLACEALASDEELRNEWKNRARYLLVDEYQDINQAQYNLIKILSEGQTDGLFVVGDDDQSIYSFRGGAPKYIREFEEYFGSESKIGRLFKSFRCPEHILKGARGMLSNFYNGENKPEPTFDSRIKINNKISFYDMSSDKYEAMKIAEISKSKGKAEKIIIIVPSRNYLPPIKDALSKTGLDYRCKGKLNDDGLVRFNAIANCVEDPKNSFNLRYLIELIIENHDRLTHTMTEGGDRITAKRIAASEMIANFWNDVHSKKSLYAVINAKTKNGSSENEFLTFLKYTLDALFKLMKEKGNSREGIVRFLGKSGLLVAPAKTPYGIINEIKEWQNEIVGPYITSTHEPINIYSIQSAKGLEGDIIFVVGLSDGIFPNPENDLEEQSRLFFVAMTRAKKELHLFSARTRSTRVTYQKVSYQLQKSNFIRMIPESHIEMHEIYSS